MTFSGSPSAWRLFEVAFRPWLRTRLAGIHVGGLPTLEQLDPSLPLLLVANHTSWFDGFLLREVHRSLRPAGPLHTIMLERELRGRPILRMLGGMGFDPERPATFRKVLRGLERMPTHPAPPTISFFPQGKIFPSFRNPLGFHGGVELLARHLGASHILPVGIHLEGGNRTRPRAFLSAGPLVTVTAGASPLPRELELLVQEETRRIRDVLARWGEDGPDQWEKSRRAHPPSGQTHMDPEEAGGDRPGPSAGGVEDTSSRPS
jgi:1-acyl-sn-glycerol-3-phosphate acyltransferase